MEIKRSERRAGFALLLLDLDGLKHITTLRHLTGSHAICGWRVLSSAGTSIRGALRRRRVCSCLGGNRRKAANQVAQSICDNIANDRWDPLLSVSIGIAVYPMTVKDRSPPTEGRRGHVRDENKKTRPS